ncbi:hypothetical protein [uncultured Butyricimonas sp.]|uniref:hypothetical protein n=1 Tax=uncultured Butyricimonas sp. TaxID=1268785 RepID=UPI0026DD4DC4|nr:hypothetical protein [uncultured Butyricimonas sp.]
MKTLFMILLICMAFIVSCSEEIVEPYTSSDNYIFFLRTDKVTAVDSFYDYKTTVYLPSGSKTRDTLYFKVGVGGNYVHDARKIKLEQYTFNDMSYVAEEAVPGVDYVAFDDPVMEEYYTIPSDSLEMMIPVIITSSSMYPRKVLNFRLVGNDDFKVFHKGTQELGINSGRIKIGY